MKKSILRIAMALFLGISLAGFYGCGSGTTDDGGNNTQNTDNGTAGTDDAGANVNDNDDSATGAEAAYICPMKCEGSESTEPGQCPGCGMDLVLASELAEGDDDGHDHDGHDHDHGDGHDHDHN